MQRLLLAITWLLFTFNSAANPLAFGALPNGQKIRTADPSAHVWRDGRLYVYVSHDEECQSDFHMKDWHLFSTSDLKQWTAHGAVLALTDLKWADNYAWAPDAAFKNGQYYLIVPAGTGIKDRINPEKSTKWMGIGVAVSADPTGPFRDAIGAPLWREPYANDPSVFTDTDGQTYLYFHGKGFDYQVVKMADDLRSIQGDFYKMDMGGYEPKMEGPWVFKRDQLYYFTMPENNRALSYYTSTSPQGPWTYRGVFMEAEGEHNNHHSIVYFQGQWLLFYHRWLIDESVAAAGGCQKPQRHVALERLTFDENGLILPVRRSPVVAGFRTLEQ